jgi:hypothetical protein
VEQRAWNVPDFFSHLSFRALRTPTSISVALHADAELISSSNHFAVHDYQVEHLLALPGRSHPFMAATILFVATSMISPLEL